MYNQLVSSFLYHPLAIIFQSGSHQVTREVTEKLPVKMLNIPSYARWFVRLAGISGASAVALGAYGAHGV